MLKKNSEQKIKLLFLWGLLIALLITMTGNRFFKAMIIQKQHFPKYNFTLSQTKAFNQNKADIKSITAKHLFHITSQTVNEFPLGIYDRIDKPEHLDAIKEMGFNLIMPYTNPYAEKNYQAIKTYLDAAKAANLRIILEPFRNSIKEQNWNGITKFIRAFKNHPALFAWYSYDEPVYHNIPPELLEKVYQIIKTEDNIHPVVLDFSGSRSHKLIYYRNSFDICKTNQYPLKKNSSVSRVLRSFQSQIDHIARLTQDIPHWMVIQSFQDDKWRLPSFAEQKYMLYSGLLNGADGIFFYGYHRAPSQWQNVIVKPLVRELKNYLPAIQEGAINGRASSDHRDLQLALYSQPHNNHVVLVAINHGKKGIDANIKFDAQIAVQSFVREQNNSILNQEQNTLTDYFEPFEAKIYEINAS